MRPALFASLLCASFAPLALAQTPQQPETRESQALPSLASLVSSVKAAVVSVDVQARSDEAADADDLGDELFERFFGGGGRRSRRGHDQIRQGAGSGFIIDPNGLVLTNNHVVQGAISIRVHLDDGRTFDAETLGRDPLTDVALIRIRGKQEHLPVARLGNSDAIRVGDWVVAIGNPFQLASSVSVGIISAKARNIHQTQYDDFLQTDAAINFGNSGGPLFNMRGEVIGINSAIAAGASGIGFAVPIDVAKALLPQLQAKGSVTRGWLGVGIQDLTPEIAKGLGVPVSEGAIISWVNDNSPAATAGLKQDDVVVSFDGQKVTSGSALSRTVAMKRPGTTVVLALYRGDHKSEIPVALGTRPDLEGLEAKPEPQEPQKPKQRLGLALSDMDPRYAQASGLPLDGALVTDVSPASPADRAELTRGMVVIEAGGKPVHNSATLLHLLKAAKPGSVVLLRVLTPGERMLRALTIP